MIALSHLYDVRIGGRFITVQAISRDHSGTVHCRAYAPGSPWHGQPCRFGAGELRKLDLPVPHDGWETVRIAKSDEQEESA